MKLAHARIVTDDVPALSRFYRAFIGIEPRGSDQYAVFHLSGGQLAISGRRNLVSQPHYTNTGAAERSIILDFEVPDVDAEYVRLRQMRVHLVTEPADQPWGNRSMIARDPDGNLINVFSPIYRETTVNP